MRQAGRGRIVNMGSLAGKEGLPSLAAYSAASAGMIAFTKALSREVCDTDIRVNCVAPGPIDTRMIRDLGNATVDAMISASPLRRLGEPKEVAALVAWLCSHASAFNTGAVFDMSGGRARYYGDSKVSGPATTDDRRLDPMSCDRRVVGRPIKQANRRCGCRRFGLTRPEP
jgi:2-dehydro-3-deoxy-L-rhamnonate dehydrogenase (NAD+)